jgi:hypothetical protein
MWTHLTRGLEGVVVGARQLSSICLSFYSVLFVPGFNWSALGYVHMLLPVMNVNSIYFVES